MTDLELIELVKNLNTKKLELNKFETDVIKQLKENKKFIVDDHESCSFTDSSLSLFNLQSHIFFDQDFDTQEIKNIGCEFYFNFDVERLYSHTRVVGAPQKQYKEFLTIEEAQEWYKTTRNFYVNRIYETFEMFLGMPYTPEVQKTYESMLKWISVNTSIRNAPKLVKKVSEKDFLKNNLDWSFIIV